MSIVPFKTASDASQPALFAVDQPAHHVLLLAAHEPSIDPRLGWIEANSPPSVRVHQLGVLHPSHRHGYLRQTESGNMVRATPRKEWRNVPQSWRDMIATHPSAKAALDDLTRFVELLRLSPTKLCATLGAPEGHERLAHFQWYLQYILDTTATLVPQAAQMQGLSGVIATDLDTLPAALLLKAILNVPVLYDAHEYWPEADVASLPFEIDFWIGLEQRMVRHADYRQTVSPGLARMMSEQYGVAFSSVPNCEPLVEALPKKDRDATHDDRCRFLFLGGFASQRGIDILIAAWPETPNNAVLLLQGPDNLYKEDMLKLARATGLLNKRIFFPAAVSEDALIATATAADVGLIPYTLAGNGYRYCSPNKMSQYMAASLPILANTTEFVADTVQEAQCGMVFDFSSRDKLIRTIAELTENEPLRRKLGDAGRRYFLDTFNWNKVSSPLYNAIVQLSPGLQTFQFESTKDAAPLPPATVYYAPPPPEGSGFSTRIGNGIFNTTLRPLIRFMYRQLQEQRGSFFFRLVRPAYRLIPARWRYYLIHRAR